MWQFILAEDLVHREFEWNLNIAKKNPHICVKFSVEMTKREGQIKNVIEVFYEQR